MMPEKLEKVFGWLGPLEGGISNLPESQWLQDAKVGV